MKARAQTELNEKVIGPEMFVIGIWSRHCHGIDFSSCAQNCAHSTFDFRLESTLIQNCAGIVQMQTAIERDSSTLMQISRLISLRIWGRAV